jgi:ADP-heptose:LPS heptosyltransferase
MTGHVLVVRLDSMGDMLICGPAIRAIAATAATVTVLAGPRGVEIARELPGVNDVLSWDCPWISAHPTMLDRAGIDAVIVAVADRHVDEAVLLTSFHQSALPTALVLRLAGVRRITACSTDYPGYLLDVRLTEPADVPEPVRMLAVAEGAGFRLPAGDDGMLRVRDSTPSATPLLETPYVVLHPGAAAPARTCSPHRWREHVHALLTVGWRVALTGAPDEQAVVADILRSEPPRDGRLLDLCGSLSLRELAGVLARAAAVVIGNTGPAHLAAAVGTPVVSLFAPVVPATRWAPYTDSAIVLGHQLAPCAGSRATRCPTAGHPCLDQVASAEVLAAIEALVRRDAAAARPATLARAGSRR